jgi:hypothetical protein
VTSLGDEAFRCLLVKTSIFLSVGNNCFMQMSGPAIYDLYEHKSTRQSTDKGIKRKRGIDNGTGRASKRSKKDVQDERPDKVRQYRKVAS